MGKKGLTERFTVGQRVAQLYHGSDGSPNVVDLKIVSVTPKSVTMQVLSPLDDDGPYNVAFTPRELPRTYDPKDVDKMFTDYIKSIHRWSDVELPVGYSPTDFSRQIKRLMCVLIAWRKRKAAVSAESPDKAKKKKAARKRKA